MVNKWHQCLNGKEPVVVRETSGSSWYQQSISGLLSPSPAVIWALLRNSLMTNCCLIHRSIMQQWAIAQLSLLCRLYDVIVKAVQGLLNSRMVSAWPLWCSLNFDVFNPFITSPVIYSVTLCPQLLDCCRCPPATSAQRSHLTFNISKVLTHKPPPPPCPLCLLEKATIPLQIKHRTLILFSSWHHCYTLIKATSDILYCHLNYQVS